MPSVSKTTQISQFSPRGRRNAAVKNRRMRRKQTAAMKISAAQWWICRISNPARTSKLRRRVESYALLTGTPRSGRYEPS